MVKLEATKQNGFIKISESNFEHLLNCLDNQKFIHEVNADAMEDDFKETRIENQDCIDDFNRQCRDLLHRTTAEGDKINLSTLIKVWDIIHVNSTGDLGFCDLDNALAKCGVKMVNDISSNRPEWESVYE